jgi:hypothetical protein
MFTRLKIVPRWIIFLLDLIFCAFSLFIAYIISFNFELNLLGIKEMIANSIFAKSSDYQVVKLRAIGLVLGIMKKIL